MANRPSSRAAVLDFDETLVEGTLASKIVRRLAHPRKNRGVIPRKYYLKAIRYSHLPILTKLKRFYRVYRYLLRSTYNLYLDLLSDPSVDKEGLFKIIREVVDEVELPPESREFLRLLKARGYRLVLVTAIPQEIAELLGKKFGFDEVYGSRPGFILDREGKEKVIKELKKKYCVCIIVGNPGNEPFWLAEELSIVVKSPKDLRRWLQKL